MRTLSLRETVLLTQNAERSFDNESNITMLLDSMQEVTFQTVKSDLFTTTIVWMDGEKITSDSVDSSESRVDVTFLLENIQKAAV